jgi:2,3-dimethylmalate lyase
VERNSTKLRKLLEKGEFFIMVGVGTAQEAQMAEKIGFSSILIAGSKTSAIILGLPDAGLITLTEAVENVERICDAVSIPALVDCDTGFGNAINVRRTVASVIRAGGAGIFMEDQVAPKRCGFVKGKELISLEEAVGKFRAAVDVRNELDPDFIIQARTDARGAVGGSLEEVIRRAKAYLEVGVDVIHAEALQSKDDIKEVRSALKDRWLYCSTQGMNPPLTQKEMQDLGLRYNTVNLSLPGAIATWDFLTELKERGLDFYSDFRQKTKHHPMGHFNYFNLAGFPKVAEWEEKYLTPENLKKYVASIGDYDPRGRHKGKE